MLDPHVPEPAALGGALREAIDSLGIQEQYHNTARDRYLRTLKLVSDQIAISRETRVAEIGPGPLIVALRGLFDCHATAMGLMTGDWQRALETTGVESVRWDLSQAGPWEQQPGFDVVLMCEVIEHLNRWPVEVLEDVRRILKPQGKLVLTTVNMVRLSNRFRMLRGRTPIRTPFERTDDGVNHIREYTLGETIYYLERAGFTPLRQERWSCYGGSPSGVMARWVSTVCPTVSNYFALVATPSEGGQPRKRVRHLGG